MITLHPRAFLEVEFGESVETRCEANNAIGISWFKREWYGDVQTNITGNTFRLVNVTAADQGVYYCRANGGIGFVNSPADSDPVVILVTGTCIDTFL